MIRNILSFVAALLLGAVVYKIAFVSLPPPVEQHSLSIGLAREVMQLTSLRVPATVFVARGQVLPAKNFGDSIQEFLIGEEKKQVILFLKGQLDFGIDFKSDPGFTVTKDDQHKVVRITVPPPRLLHIADQEIEVAFVFGPVTADDINAAKNKAIRLMINEAASPRYLSIAQSACAKQLSILAEAFGYTAEIIWRDAPSVPK